MFREGPKANLAGKPVTNSDVLTNRQRTIDIDRADVHACLKEATTFTQRAWGSTFDLELCAKPGLPPALCDHLGLQNAVLHLLFNARDAMPNGGKISVNAVAHEQNAVVEIRVRDSGIGMSRDTLRRSLDPFFTTKGTGLGGFGLPIVKQFADRFDGSIGIQSSLGTGTTVTLRLPSLGNGK